MKKIPMQTTYQTKMKLKIGWRKEIRWKIFLLKKRGFILVKISSNGVETSLQSM
ncbi:unnamed protein product [Acanthoscelides obtectus]|uniref:Uncharacterized protein n=1 Tax=Acanthoscelides obtectus TaxID=200917 RepID=A0A9P0M497_ACAOB|nr:unnamed protein product [Acanthoscelides obtectus]CAK1662759.1 hypothetical protein AOBTE_LOCUS23292 [Acanthoscelides obtectus]